MFVLLYSDSSFLVKRVHGASSRTFKEIISPTFYLKGTGHLQIKMTYFELSPFIHVDGFMCELLSFGDMSRSDVSLLSNIMELDYTEKLCSSASLQKS